MAATGRAFTCVRLRKVRCAMCDVLSVRCVVVIGACANTFFFLFSSAHFYSVTNLPRRKPENGSRWAVFSRLGCGEQLTLRE